MKHGVTGFVTVCSPNRYPQNPQSPRLANRPEVQLGAEGVRPESGGKAWFSVAFRFGEELQEVAETGTWREE